VQVKWLCNSIKIGISAPFDGTAISNHVECLFPAKMFEVGDVRSHSHAHFRVFDIHNSEILAGFLNDLADSWVVNMGDTGKKGGVQSGKFSHLPTRISICCVLAKFAVRLQLVNGPFILHLGPWMHYWTGKWVVFDRMSKLKDDTQDKNRRREQKEEGR